MTPSHQDEPDPQAFDLATPSAPHAHAPEIYFA